MTSKTIVLTGEEIKVEYSGGCNAWLRNDGTATVDASGAPGISAGADGVVSIPVSGSAPVYGANGTVYLKGTGSVQLIGSDYSTNPFRNSAASGGSGADEQARAAIEAHAGNADIHVTADEKAGWNGKAELSDIPAKLGYVNYLGYVSDVGGMLNNPGYSGCSYECVITTAEAALMGLPSCWWQIKYLRHTDNNGFGCQIAFPIDGPDNSPRYRTSAGLAWADWKLLCDGGNAATLDSHPASDFALQNTFAAHVTDNTVHVTSAEKASWGGYSNENLFDNPDFAINQRGATQYTDIEKVGTDRWTLQGGNGAIKMTVLPSGGVKVTNAGPNAGIKQFYPEGEITAGETYTISAEIDGVRRSVTITAALGNSDVTGYPDNPGVAVYPNTAIYAAIIYDSADKKWAIFPYVTYTADQEVIIKDVKLELGSRATRFAQPIPAVELLKCQRYYQIRSTNDIDPVDLRPVMRTTPTDITKVTGGYAYVAEY